VITTNGKQLKTPVMHQLSVWPAAQCNVWSQ